MTHSFGGILVRAWAADAEPGRVGRVVMLAPPNHGSELSDLIGSSRLLSFLAGPVVRELATVTVPSLGPSRTKLPMGWTDLLPATMPVAKSGAPSRFGRLAGLPPRSSLEVHKPCDDPCRSEFEHRRSVE